MKCTLRTVAAALALALAGFGLTGCSDDPDCDTTDDSAATTTVQYEPAGYAARIGGTTGGRGGGGGAKARPAPNPKPKAPSGSSGGTRVHTDHDDCEDD